MDQKEVQMLAAEFVLGTLNRAMLLQFKNELSQNPALREAVKDWERRLGMSRGGLLMHPRKPKALQTRRETPVKQPAFDRTGNRAINQKRDELKPAAKMLGAAERDPLLDIQTQREVQAALDQISQDSTLASRVRCGQTAQRIPRSSPVAKPASPAPGMTRPQSTARAVRPDSSPVTNPETSLHAQARTAIQAAPSESQEHAVGQSAAESRELSRDQAALKVQSVLNAARNILAKQNLRTGEPPAAPKEAPEKAAGETAPQKTEKPAAALLRAEDGEWDALAPRVYKKQLNRDDNFNRQSYLLRMIPGGRIQPQRRGGIEEIYVIEGRIAIGEETLGPGDFQAFDVKSFVSEITAAGDSLILVRGHIVDRIPDPEGTA